MMNSNQKVLFCLVFLTAEVWAGVGMKVKFASLRLDNLLPGEVYNTREIVNLPYTMTNTSDGDATGNIVVYAPQKKDCREGWDPVEDIIWVQVSDNIIDLRPGGVKTVDIIIRIPDRPEYYDRRFQANIEAVARVKQGNIAAGVTTKIYLSTVPTLEERERREKQKRERDQILANLNYDFLPGKTLLFDIEPGRKYDVGKESGKKLKIVNMNDEKYKYRLVSVSAETAKQPTGKGYEASPEPGWLTFEKDIFKLDENTILPVKAFLKIPKEKKHFGMRYQFFIRVDLLEQKIPVSIYSYVLVQVKEK